MKRQSGKARAKMKKIEVYEWEGNSMRGLYKKLTFEDKFARKYYCNSYRFLPSMKRRNRKKLRRLLKIATDINVATKKEVQNDKASKPLKR